MNNCKKGRIHHQLAIYMIGLVVAVILLCFFLNTTLMKDVYVLDKEKTMRSAFNTISLSSEDGSLYDDDFLSEFQHICAINNLMIAVVSSDGEIQISSGAEKGDDFILEQLLRSIFRMDDTAVIVSSDSNYVIERQTDNRSGMEYLTLWGTLLDGNTIIMRCAIESLEGSAAVSNQFLLFVGIFAIIISVIAAEILARRISRPILELTNLSKRMNQLDFEAKYIPRKRENEVDELGRHMNTMSETLEETIGELKESNLKLQKDIEIRDKNEQMRKEFVSNVSHELKTPLAVIQGYAEGLSDGIFEDPEDCKYYCDVIVDEAQRMNRIVKELLVLNQLEYGKDNISMERFDIVSLIHGIIESTRILMEQNEIQLVFEETDPIYVWADEFLTEQVVSNYLTNAIHYAKGEKRITISVDNLDSGVRVHVVNTGDLIPEESIPHLWEKFYKVDKARTREYGGSGIGLSVVKAIMDSFHKECGVRNLEDSVEFWFELDK